MSQNLRDGRTPLSGGDLLFSGEPDDLEPVLADLGHDFHEPFKPDGLGNEAVNAEVIGPENVFLGL